VLPLSSTLVGVIVLVVVWQLAAWSFVPAVQASLYQAAGPGGNLAVSFAVSGFNVGIVSGAGLGGVALNAGGLSAVALLGAAMSLVAFGMVYALVSARRPAESGTAAGERVLAGDKEGGRT
jgi:DHA1 family inner membrane transport protein